MSGGEFGEDPFMRTNLQGKFFVVMYSHFLQPVTVNVLESHHKHLISEY